MNRFFLLLATVSLTLASNACKKSTRPASALDEEPEPAVIGLEPDGGPADVAAINTYIESIEKARPTLGIRGPVTVEFGKRIIAEAQVYNADSGVPVLIYCQIREVEQWYYLFNRRVVQFRERRPADNGFEERRWNYTYEKVLGGEVRTADSPDALVSAKPTPLGPDQAKVAESHGVVNKYAFEILFGKLPE